MKLITLCNLLIALSFLNFINARYVGDSCTANDELSRGICTVVTDCLVAVQSVVEKGYHGFARCGFSGIYEVVCCPQGQEINKHGEVMSTTTHKTTTKKTTPWKQTTTEASVNEKIADRECKKIIASSIPPLDLHIIGGDSASLGEFPHMVALGFEKDGVYSFNCGGSLISPNFVITAAHCIDTLDRIPPTIVRTGVIELGNETLNNETDIKVQESILHPLYTRRTKYHDLALLKLEKPVEVSTTLNYICLYTGSEDPQVSLAVTGWGTTNTTRDTRSNILLKTRVSLVPREQCESAYASLRKLPNGITNTQLCAGDPTGHRDTCQGDSGGPIQGLTTRDGYYRLIGITSFGRGCGSSVPGVYTRISAYVDWIESVVWP